MLSAEPEAVSVLLFCVMMMESKLCALLIAAFCVLTFKILFDLEVALSLLP